MQGWTGIAKWSGIPLRDVLAQVTPLADARYVMVESFGLAQKMHDGRPLEPYYTVLPVEVAMEPETILAWGMNDGPLPDMYGAPLRLRIESMHGYKMVKWVRSVTWIRDYAEVGDGMGGTREDSGYQDINARI
jgi:DMSO/TMAO reductase YedYZ molybdopterin-dependent catalytic subunit